MRKTFRSTVVLGVKDAKSSALVIQYRRSFHSMIMELYYVTVNNDEEMV